MVLFHQRKGVWAEACIGVTYHSGMLHALLYVAMSTANLCISIVASKVITPVHFLCCGDATTLKQQC